MITRILITILSVLLCSVLLVWVFWTSIEKNYIVHYLETFASSTWEMEFKYDSLEKIENRWVISHPSLVKGDEKVLTAEKMVLEPILNLFHGSFHIDAFLHQPNIKLNSLKLFSRKKVEHHRKKNRRLIPKIGFFNIHGSLEISQGHLVNNDNDLFFDIKSQWQDSFHLLFRTFQNEEKNHASLIFSSDDKGDSLSFDCKNLDCSLLQQLLNSYWPNVSNWSVSKGTVNGYLKKFEETFSGYLKFNDLKISNSLLHLEGYLPETDLLLRDYNQELQILKPAVVEFTDTVFNAKLAELLGNLVVTKHQPAKGSLAGKFIRNETTYPLFLEIEIHPEKVDDELFRLQLFTQDKELPISLALTAYDSPKGMQINGMGNFSNDPIFFACDIETGSEIPKPKMGSWIAWALTINDFSIQNGKFQAHDINLSELATKLMDRWKFQGHMDIQGCFDSKEVIARVDLKNGSIEHPDFTLKLEQSLPVYYYYDLLSGKHGGALHLSKGQLEHKPSKFLFTDIAGTVLLEKHAITIFDLQLFSNGMFLEGALEANSLHNGHYQIQLYGQRFQSNIDNLKTLLTLFHTPFDPLNKISGELNVKNGGAYLAFNISPEGFSSVKTKLEGELIEGKYSDPSLNFAVQDLSCKYKYDNSHEKLEVRDLFGTLIFNDLDYSIIGDSVKIDLNRKGEFSFDLSLGDRNKDFLRLVGASKLLDKEKLFELTFDPLLTHFGAIYPEKCSFVFKENGDLYQSDFIAHIDLAALQKELKNFEVTNRLAKELNGEVDISVAYNQNMGQLDFKISSPEIAYESKKIKNFSVVGNKKDRSWVIEHCVLDDLSISGDFTEQKNGWKINFFGIEKENILLAGLEGFYNLAENNLKGHFNLLKVNLAAVNDYLPDLSGEVKATGMFQLKKKEKSSKWLFEANLDTQLSQIAFQNMVFDNLSNMKCMITNNQIELFAGKGSFSNAKTEYSFNNLRYVFNGKLLEIKDCVFRIPQEQLSYFSNKLPESTVKPLSYLKNDLQGSFDLILSPNNYNLAIKLAPGMYQIDKYPIQLTDFALNLDPLEIKVETSCCYYEIPVSFRYRSLWPQLETGTLNLHYLIHDPLNVYWQNNQIKKIEGSLPGIEVHLVESSNNLEGDLTVNPKNAAPLLPQIFERLGMEGNFTLRGKWNQDFAFEGTCEAKNFKIAQIDIDYAFADLSVEENKIKLRNLQISDAAGTVASKQVLLDYAQPEHLVVMIPEINGTQLKLGTPFTIKNLEVRNLSGDLLDVKSLTGTGTMLCTNIAQNSVLKIPEEQLLPFGLNLSMLTPISGTIYFNLEKGKCLFTKLKDAYSAGKMTRFYLARDKESYIDFEGMFLHIFLKMKQHTLLTKLIEMFTVSIEGSVSKPVYKFSKDDT